MRSRNLSEATLRKYRLLNKQIDDFSGLRFLHLKDFTVERVRDFRKTWKDGPRAAGKSWSACGPYTYFGQTRG